MNLLKLDELESDLQGASLMLQALCSKEEECRKKTVDLGGLGPMVTILCYVVLGLLLTAWSKVRLLGAEEPELQWRAAYAVSTHGTSDDVRQKFLDLDGVAPLVKNLSSDEREVCTFFNRVDELTIWSPSPNPFTCFDAPVCRFK